MFRNYLEKGKEWMDKVTSAVMSFTELEIKVREATSDEPWGPHGKILNDLAYRTNEYEGLSEIMMMLWTRIFPENPFNWRRVYKGLTVLSHLLRFGSDRVVDAARDHLYDLRTLENYQCIDERGRDQGASVRLKVQEVLELIQDSEFLQAERKKAQSNQKVYSGIGSTGTHGYGFSGNTYSSNANDEDDEWGQDTYHFPSSQPRGEMPWNSNASADQSNVIRPPQRLGSFDSWKGGREQTMADEVADKLSSVLHVAKVVTNDFFGRPRVPPPSMYEEDPHKVSEEVFSFPNAQVDGVEDEFDSYQKVPYSSPTEPPRRAANCRPETAAKQPSSLIDLGNSAAQNSPAAPFSLPRPPSVELPSSSPPQKAHPSGDLFSDPFSELPRPQLQEQQQSPKMQTPDFFAEFSSPPPSAPHQHQPPSNPVGRDPDFGDFVGLPSVSPVHAKPSPLVNPPAVDGLLTPRSAQLDPISPMPVKANTTPDFAHFSSPVAAAWKTPMRASQFESANQPSGSPASNKIGKTWTGLDSFNIDLDLRSGAKSSTKPAAPSLSQLQSLNRVNNTTPSHDNVRATDSNKSDTFADFAAFN